MDCPKCHHQHSKVVDSRPADEGTAIRRRRECLECRYRFSTYERVERAPLLVIKKDGTREAFNRDKLLKGIVRAAEKRPVTMEQMNRLVNQVENKIRELSEPEINSLQIGEMVMPLLLTLDEVSYIRFASVYRQFHSREMFMKALESMNELVGETLDD